ncbi:SigE family RNA polymerase sigma factor [Nocardioides daeguensis]|uniref:SigE family RNA polymerase sigma factor n=1 Tax=Nocardioides daeguensis TaxID=908359 RepID=A0ABP6V0K8_9ACTN|nr:SigE family RNA polymerase sigma factor [Nocardioides daeguensis]MBV6727141.1 SigE family RNA polymerase sigma factor [Nocardioides daeguensis]MCR1771155.1 SigE family RNA polymerase sigma factor [Nocardioides daeguensis]
MEPETEAAYADSVQQSWPSLVRAAVFLGARPHEAEDLAQTTLVRCYTGWTKVSSAENRDAYVYRMLLNCLRDVRRTRWWKDRQYDAGLDAAHTAEPDATDRVALADAVHRALGGLTKPNREVVVLRYFVQLTERQTAEVLGIAAGTVKSRLSRALAHLAADDHLLDFTGGSR